MRNGGLLLHPGNTAPVPYESESESLQEGIEAGGFLFSVTAPRSNLRLVKLKICSNRCEIVLGRGEKTARIDERLWSAD